MMFVVIIALFEFLPVDRVARQVDIEAAAIRYIMSAYQIESGALKLILNILEQLRLDLQIFVGILDIGIELIGGIKILKLGLKYERFGIMKYPLGSESRVY